MAGAPSEVEGTSEPLKYKTWILRVSIHCEGCKRKVKKILHSVEGVYTIDVDSKQHKVTVTGNVDPNILIRKLKKSGKHAEPWSRGKRNNDQEVSEQRDEEQGYRNPTVDDAQKNAGENQPPPTENPNAHNGTSNGNNENSNGQAGKHVRFAENIATGNEQKPPANNPRAPNSSGGGGGSKKKKKKKNNHNHNHSNNANNNSSSNASVNNGGGEQQPNGGPQSSELPPSEGRPPGPYPNTTPVNMSQPLRPHHDRVYEYPPTYDAPPSMCAVSYNTAYPSFTASYYSAPPPYSYAYVHHGPDVEPSTPSDWGYSAPPQPSDTFEIFSDENPNACSVM